MKRICIVSSVHLCYNPRVLKEADAFFEAGYDVVVVTINANSRLHEFDEELMRSRKWSLKTASFRNMGVGEKLNWIVFSFTHLFFRSLSKLTFRFGIGEQSAFKGYHSLLRLAKKQKADFYLVHHSEALPIGYKASKFANGILGFDAEDFQTGMAEGKSGFAEERLLTFLEKKYLPMCEYFTAASPGIGNAISRKYGVGPFKTILNVFPKEEIKNGMTTGPVKFYWYSQVIGPNRSLETLLAAGSTLKKPFELHIRGKFHSTSYELFLKGEVERFNLSQHVFFHEPILATQIIQDAARFDVGLAIETDISINRNICVTNKVFSYLMSGLAILGSDTDGQVDIFSHFEEAVYICRKNDVESLRDGMLFFIENPDKLLGAKQAARRAALERFNWECESTILLEHLKKALA